MSGGGRQGQKTRGGAGRSPDLRGDYTARVFCPQGLALTTGGPQAPELKKQSQP